MIVPYIFRLEYEHNGEILSEYFYHAKYALLHAEQFPEWWLYEIEDQYHENCIAEWDDDANRSRK